MMGVRLLAALSVWWVLLLLAAPFLIAPVAAAVYAVGSLVCHQLPDRSFHMGAYQLPVCARCFGIYAGFALIAPGLVLHRRSLELQIETVPDPATQARETTLQSRWRSAARVTSGAGLGWRRAGTFARLPLSPKRARALVAAGTVPTAVTLAAEWGGVWATSNSTRAIAGALLGMAVAAVVIPAWAALHYDQCPPRLRLASSPPRPPI